MSALELRMPSTVSPYKRQTPTLWQVMGQAIWRALESAGQRRAAHELRLLADRWEPFDREFAQQLRESSLHNVGH